MLNPRLGRIDRRLTDEARIAIALDQHSNQHLAIACPGPDSLLIAHAPCAVVSAHAVAIDVVVCTVPSRVILAIGIVVLTLGRERARPINGVPLTLLRLEPLTIGGVVPTIISLHALGVGSITFAVDSTLVLTSVVFLGHPHEDVGARQNVSFPILIRAGNGGAA